MENKYKITIDLEALCICEYMEESYLMLLVYDGNKKVGKFQMCNTELFEKESLIKFYENFDVNELMERPVIYDVPIIIRDLHDRIMSSSNMCVYSSDFAEHFDTEEYGLTWDEYLEWLTDYVATHPKLKDSIDFTDRDNDFILFGDFMSAFNLYSPNHCPRCNRFIEDLMVDSTIRYRLTWDDKTKKYNNSKEVDIESVAMCPHCDCIIETEWEL